MEHELMEMPFRMKSKKDGEDKPEVHNDCQDCITIPDKQPYFEVESYWKILIEMQTEMGELWQDLNNYNKESDVVIHICNEKKKDLEVIIQNIN